MNFEVNGSDSWGTDAFQERFISDYFGSSSSVASVSDEIRGQNGIIKPKKSKTDHEESDNKEHKTRKKQKVNHENHNISKSDTSTPLKIHERLLNLANYRKGHSTPSPHMSNLQQPAKSKSSNMLKKKKKNQKLIKHENNKRNILDINSSVALKMEHRDTTVPFRSRKSGEEKPMLLGYNNSTKGNLSTVSHLSETLENHSKKFKHCKKGKDCNNNNKGISKRNLNLFTEDKPIMLRNENHIKLKNNESHNTDMELDKKDTEVQDKHLETKSSLLRQKAQSNLQAARFRLLNEKLYTVPGTEAYEYFQGNIDDFKAYHDGYQLQVKKWPINPVDLIIEDLRHRSKSSVIADLGCGDAKIARTFRHQKIYSFDLVALNEHVTCCDISNVPLPNESVDIAVFCLSLMGINLSDYLLQAFRILRQGGLLKIAEVESRIRNLEEFIKSIELYGFELAKKDVSHKMFVLLDFNKVKQKVKKSKLQAIKLQPCLYKKR